MIFESPYQGVKFGRSNPSLQALGYEGGESCRNTSIELLDHKDKSKNALINYSI